MEGQQPKNELVKTVESDQIIFKQFGLDTVNELPHPQGNIPIKYEKSPSGKDILVWGIRKGTHYPPEVHNHGHVLTIKQGSGVVSIAGEEKHYTVGDVFQITGNTPHGFVKVSETTVVFQEGLE